MTLSKGSQAHQSVRKPSPMLLQRLPLPNQTWSPLNIQMSVIPLDTTKLPMSVTYLDNDRPWTRLRLRMPAFQALVFHLQWRRQSSKAASLRIPKMTRNPETVKRLSQMTRSPRSPASMSNGDLDLHWLHCAPRQ